MMDTKLLETIADIAYFAGYQKYTTGDSRQDISTFICWAEEFEKQTELTNWHENDYILAIDNFSNQKIRQSRREQREHIQNRIL